MPSHEAYTQNEGQVQVGAQNLLSMIGQSKWVTGGWPGFAIKALSVSFSSGTVFGLASYMLFHGPIGPALSFLAGSGFGFIGGLVHRWRTDVSEALQVAKSYPLLIEHHVRAGEAARELDGRSFSEWARDLRHNPRKQGIVIAAMYSAAPALDRLRQEQEEALVAAYLSGESAADGSK